MENNKIKIPEGVVDKASYLKYLKLSKHPILNEEKIVETSDGIEIPLGTFPHIIQKKISHLHTREQIEIMEKKELYSSINNNATKFKRLAFGHVQGRQKKGTSILLTRREEMLEYFGRMFTVEEVLKVINEEWGIPINKEAVARFRRENAGEIEKLIDKFKASYSDIRLGVKRSRLEELVYLYGKQKQKYERSSGKEDYKLLLVTLEQIRKEAEGDRLTIDGKLDVSYEVNIQEHLRDEVFKTLNIKEIILGRVAARMGVNPIKLVYSLQNSFYNKFSNVLGNLSDDVDSSDVVYPSQMNYNFEKIQKYQERRDEEIQDAVILEEKKDDKDVNKAEEIKRALLEKLRKKKEILNQTSASIKEHSKNK
jgi:hypothetical protein